MSASARTFIWFTLILMFLMAIGCRSTTPQISYYALSTAGGGQIQALNATPIQTRIGIGPIVLPAYLDRHQMVIRTGPNQLRIDDYHLWAAPLSEEMPRILAENIMQADRALRVDRAPWGHRFTPDIVIGIQIFTFEAHGDGRVHLNAAVTMSDQRSEAQNSWSVDLEEQAQGRAYTDFVAAQSRILAKLGRQIAKAIP